MELQLILSVSYRNECLLSQSCKSESRAAEEKYCALNISYRVLEYIHHHLEQWSTWGKRTPGGYTKTCQGVCKI
jgi:hypothetical protein